MLTARQRRLLKIIIEEFIDTSEAVGSLNISDKYALAVSPATIRNEMAKLAELGLLEKAHASAGRRPTSDAIKWFLEEVLDDIEEPDILIPGNLKEDLFQQRFNIDRLLTEAVKGLSELTNNTALAMFKGRRYIAGTSQFIDQPGYSDLIRLRKILTVLEDYNYWAKLFSKFEQEQEVQVLIGEETGLDACDNSAVAFAQIKVHGNEKGYIAIIGSNCMDYKKVISALRYVVKIIQDSVQGW
jgi:transcriptional regulator of heat shock response